MIIQPQEPTDDKEPIKRRSRWPISRLPALAPFHRGFLAFGCFLVLLLGVAEAAIANQPGLNGGGVAGMVFGIFVVIVSVGGLGIVIVAPRPNPPPTLQERIAALADSMRRSAGLVEQVSAELEAREKVVLALEARAKAAEDSTRLNEEAAAALSQLLDVRLDRSEKRM